MMSWVHYTKVYSVKRSAGRHIKSFTMKKPQKKWVLWVLEEENAIL